MKRLLVIALLTAPILVRSLGAQTPAQATLRFEAASVKRNTTADFAIGRPRFDGETFTARQVAVDMLISSAYGIPSRELVDGPRWIYFATGTDRFDVVAKAAPGSSRKFDFELTFRRVLSADPNDSGVDIFTAVRQQFGLKLEPARAPFEVGVIEHVERPTPD